MMEPLPNRDVNHMGIPENWLEIIGRFVAAFLVTAMLGPEREVRNKPAGLRTHMPVGLGTADDGLQYREDAG